MRRVILVGGGGFGTELAGYLISDRNTTIHLEGYIDDIKTAPLLGRIECLGSVLEHQVRPDCEYLISIGSPFSRKRLYNELKSKGANFFTYIHHSVYVAPNATIADGCIICPGSIVNAGARLSQNVCVNVQCSVGHDTLIGPHSVLSPYSAINGHASLGELGFMATRATIFPKVTVGDNVIIDSHSCAKMDVPSGHIVSNRGAYVVIKNRRLVND